MSLPELRRILAVRLDNIGDVVMLGPALRALRERYRHAHIAGLLSPAGATVAPMLPWLDETIVARVPWQDASGTAPFDPGALACLSEELASHHFDAAFIFTSFSQSPWPPAYACYLAGIPIRAGESKEFGGSILSLAAPSLPDSAHQVDRNLHLLRCAGIPADDVRLALDVPASARDDVAALLRGHRIDGKRLLVVCPGASCAARRYEPGRFAQAALAIAQRHGLTVVTAGSDRERALCADVSGQCGATDLAGQTSLPALAALIERADLLLANDSGPMHLADALGTPAVIAFSGTEIESQWAPRTSPAVLLRRPTDCAPCHRFECPYAMECLDIPVDDVVAAADTLLATRPSLVGGVA